MMETGNGLPLYGVILAGGSGTRFWPLSRSQYPKQVLKLLGSESLLQATIERLLPRIPLTRLAVVSNAAQADVINLDLFRKGWTDIKVWLEPQGRNTAAAVGLAAIVLPLETDTDIMAVFPADHYIGNQTEFFRALDQGAELAQAGYLVTFGIKPTRPDTGYGYLKAGKALGANGYGYQCAAFIEKPELSRAQAFLSDGGYYWNSGMFLFRRDVILDALARYLPDLHQELRLLGERDQSLEETYRKIPSISLDQGIMEKAANVAVVPADLEWSDVGTWEAFYRLLKKDSRGNTKVGRVEDLDSRNCLIFAQNRLVGTIGLEDVIVVDTADASLVCHRDRVQDVKGLVERLTNLNLEESVQHPTVEHPWGHYQIIAQGPCYKVKEIVVAPGKRLSLQLHRYRTEHWVVVEGTPMVTIGNENLAVPVNESVFVPLKTFHRLENPGQEPVKIIEVQTGTYLEEDDIVRLDDDFWRLPENADQSQTVGSPGSHR
ncbi:MAG: mannose-1-phosphate guanylyltransferase/mannose-6-phosphate isomerase [Deltaproteobacteria bacterium]|nr:MAG: mannose-1-phosphate guanylyltransferase/mannose-6-phosphate isomerase [Deltaproteobacteria bacterium]